MLWSNFFWDGIYQMLLKYRFLKSGVSLLVLGVFAFVQTFYSAPVSGFSNRTQALSPVLGGNASVVDSANGRAALDLAKSSIEKDITDSLGKPAAKTKARKVSSIVPGVLTRLLVVFLSVAVFVVPMLFGGCGTSVVHAPTRGSPIVTVAPQAESITPAQAQSAVEQVAGINLEGSISTAGEFSPSFDAQLDLQRLFTGQLSVSPADAARYLTPVSPVESLGQEDTVYVSLRFDDGWENQLGAVEVMDRYDVDGVFGIMVGPVFNGSASYLDTEQLKILADGGHEIASHTMYHPHYFQLRKKANGMQTYVEELTESKRLIDEWFVENGYDDSTFTFIAPYYAYDQDALRYIRQAGYEAFSGGYFNVGLDFAPYSSVLELVNPRTPVYSPWVEHKPELYNTWNVFPVDENNIRVVDVEDIEDPEQILDLVRGAIPGETIVLTYHQTGADFSGSKHDYKQNLGEFEAVVSGLVAMDNVEVVTHKDMVEDKYARIESVNIVPAFSQSGQWQLPESAQVDGNTLGIESDAQTAQILELNQEISVYAGLELFGQFFVDFNPANRSNPSGSVRLVAQNLDAAGNVIDQVDVLNVNQNAVGIFPVYYTVPEGVSTVRLQVVADAGNYSAEFEDLKMWPLVSSEKTGVLAGVLESLEGFAADITNQGGSVDINQAAKVLLESGQSVYEIAGLLDGSITTAQLNEFLSQQGTQGLESASAAPAAYLESMTEALLFAAPQFNAKAQSLKSISGQFANLKFDSRVYFTDIQVPEILSAVCEQLERTGAQMPVLVTYLPQTQLSGWQENIAGVPHRIVNLAVYYGAGRYQSQDPVQARIASLWTAVLGVYEDLLGIENRSAVDVATGSLDELGLLVSAYMEQGQYGQAVYLLNAATPLVNDAQNLETASEQVEQQVDEKVRELELALAYLYYVNGDTVASVNLLCEDEKNALKASFDNDVTAASILALGLLATTTPQEAAAPFVGENGMIKVEYANNPVALVTLGVVFMESDAPFAGLCFDAALGILNGSARYSGDALIEVIEKLQSQVALLESDQTQGQGVADFARTDVVVDFSLAVAS